MAFPAGRKPARAPAWATLCSRVGQSVVEAVAREEGLRIGVCIKQVPDTDSHLRIADSGQGVDDSNLNWVISSCDLCALEEALLLAEAEVARGAERPELVVFSLGPARVEEALRKALALGVDRALHLVDEALQGGDAIADGRALAAALAGERCDLVLTGAQSDDLGQAATPAVIAAILSCPYAWLVMAVELDSRSKSLRIVRELEGGMNEVLGLELPAVLAIQAGINRPRFASLRGTLQARKKPLRREDCSGLGVDPGLVGAAGAGIEIEAVSLPPAGAGGVVIDGASAEAAAGKLIAHLEREAVL
ncbi:MAG: electron transfer flavoprotein subunit beta/FixA family protein [Holophagales bacterium]|nr:electron transfer flavoprotein subunit beta/FixA family protein [Holophagales bacterium]MYC10250.1 electron transfer flavoprotein subunit beta/FixA family protein [Holophagales bacterium]